MSVLRASLCALGLAAATAGASFADPSTFWMSGPVPQSTPTPMQTSSGSSAMVSVVTGGSQGITVAQLGDEGSAETGLVYEAFPAIAIFNGGGTGTVPTTVTFTDLVAGPSHHRGLLMVGCVNAASSPVTVTSSVGGRVTSWTLVGAFDHGPNNSFPMSWNPGSGTFVTFAAKGNDSKCLVLDLGALDENGSITITLNQHLNDGILIGLGEETVAALGVQPPGRESAGLAVPAPNPATTSTTLAFSLASPSRARLTAHDLSGRRLATLADGEFGPGTRTLRWNLRDDSGARVAPGVVFLRLEAGGEVRTRRLLLAR